MSDMRRIDLLGEPTVEQRYRDAAHAERMFAGQARYYGPPLTDLIAAAEKRAELFEALANERAEERLAGALQRRAPTTIIPTLDEEDRRR
jgi:hypothetical protein